jgi:multidrug efflux pump subunit AcrB
MNIGEYSIRYKTVSLVLAATLILGGLVSFTKLGRLEDPEFTIKQALVVASYPGASPQEVADEVADEIESAVQQMPQLKRVESINKEGLSIINVEMRDKYDKTSLPQIWDELRRKINDVKASLPDGVHVEVHDDFGDVYGILLAVTGDGYSYKEIKEFVDYLRKELLLVPGVAKISVAGDMTEAVFVEIPRERMALLGLGVDTVAAAIGSQNSVSPAGNVRVGSEYVRIYPTGSYGSVEDIVGLSIRDPKSDKLIRLKDIAEIKRGYVDPPDSLLHFDGQPSISLGISIVSGGNVVDLGQAVRHKLAELRPMTPIGMKINVINYQSDDVAAAVNGFVINFVEALVIVVVILLLFMGMRSGLIIGAILAITVLGTMIFMQMAGVSLQRISLGALIIALGMLVDNAIVITEGMLVQLNAGRRAASAARDVVSQNAMPLLGATVVAVLAFSGIGLSQDASGEFCNSLFTVILISLMLSWVLAVTLTPLFCSMFLTPKKGGRQQDDSYDGTLFRLYRTFLRQCLARKYATMGVMVATLLVSLYSFGHLAGSFFPASTKPQFLIHYWLPAGTDVRTTAEDVSRIEKHLLEDERIVSIASYIGSAATRFMLTYSPETSSEKGYAVLLVSVRDREEIDAIIPELDMYLAENFPNAEPKIKKHSIGPPVDAAVEVRFSGPDPAVLRDLSEQAKSIFRAEPLAASVRDDWRQPVKVLRPIVDEERAKTAGVSAPDINEALYTSFTGRTVGTYRELDKRLPIILRAPSEERSDAADINDMLVRSSATSRFLPLSQIVSEIRVDFEDALVHRRDRKLTITASCETDFGILPSAVFSRVQKEIEAIELPIGYSMEWGGEYESSRDAQAAVASSTGFTVLLMVLIVIMLFNNLRQPLIIWLTVPFAIVGISAGLTLARLPFGFMAMLGMLSLSGMLIKNAIVLLDQINMETATGKPALQAVLDASVSRMRPVCMAAVTTILGMLPLVTDVFFQGMAVTVMGGLAFATLLTLILVPVLYAMLYKVTV